MKLLVMLLVLLVCEYLRIEKEKKIRSKKRLQLAQIRIDLELQRKREEFEKFKARIEAFKDEDVCDEIDIKEVDEVDNTFVEGITALRDNGPKYVPYERKNPLDDIRSSLSEFTVNDIINTFYI